MQNLTIPLHGRPVRSQLRPKGLQVREVAEGVPSGGLRSIKAFHIGVRLTSLLFMKHTIHAEIINHGWFYLPCRAQGLSSCLPRGPHDLGKCLEILFAGACATGTLFLKPQLANLSFVIWMQMGRRSTRQASHGKRRSPAMQSSRWHQLLLPAAQSTG